jgi:ketosteroid isomerase-like protein
MSEANVQKLKDMYAAFGRGDINTILDNVSEDVTWGTESVAQEVPWYRLRNGREGVGDFFATLAREVDFTTFDPMLFVAGDDTVLVHVNIGYKIRKNGNEGTVGSIHEFKVEDGLVRSFRAYEDTAKVARMWNS